MAVADPAVVVVAPEAGSGAALRNRLTALGFRCELVEAQGSPRTWRGADGDVLLVLEPGGYSSVVSAVLGKRRGTPLEDLPLVVVGPAPIGSPSGASEVDEFIPADAPDPLIEGRIRVWARWGRRARTLRILESRVREAQSADALTGLPGHRAFQERLEVEMKRSERYATPLGLVLADIEGMRTLNEHYGYATGDRVLREAGETLHRAVREVDMVARYEGDAFAILLPESTEEATSKVIARLRTLVSSLIFRGEPSGTGPSPLVKINVIFGQACLPDEKIRGRGALVAAAEACLSRVRNARTPPALLA